MSQNAFQNAFSAALNRFSVGFGQKPALNIHIPVLYPHWRDIPMKDGVWARRWPNFTPKELSCPRTGSIFVDPAALDCLQAMRDKLGPLRVNSAHRSPLHNAKVGGAPRSAHLQMAFDVHRGSYTRERLFMAARTSGFRSMGFYNTFLHVDRRPGRRWFGSDPRAREAWVAALGMDVLRW